MTKILNYIKNNIIPYIPEFFLGYLIVCFLEPFNLPIWAFMFWCLLISMFAETGLLIVQEFERSLDV